MAARLSIDLESVMDDFEQSWRQGQPPQLDRFLPEEHPAGSPARLLLLRELIKVDLEFRWRQSVACQRLEDYVKQFPELLQQGKVPLDLICEEYRVRHRWADKPKHQECLTRFPEHAAYLVVTLERIDAELAAEFFASHETQAPDANTSPPMAQILDEPPLPHIPGYEILGVLGRGGMGVVYKAKHLALKRLVALKMILSGAHAGPDQLARFQAEAEAVARLKHPNIVQIYDVGNHEGLPYFALEYVEGGSLDKHLAGTPQNPRSAAELVRVLAEGVHAAHQAGIVHRDLKPANVLLQPGKPGAAPLQSAIPKITDFGLAKKLDSGAGQTQTGAIMGTPSYMAPEQASGRIKEIGPAADVYALGAILYEMLTGRPPFKAETTMDIIMQLLNEDPRPPRQLQPRIPRDLETICLKCLKKTPQERYASADELSKDLQRFLEGRPITARPVGVVERTWKWVKRHPAVASFLAIGVFWVGLFGLVLLNLPSPDRGRDKEENKEPPVLPVVAERTTPGELCRLEGHKGEIIRAIAFTKDGKKAISGSIDKTIRIWDLATAKEIRKLEGHKEDVLCLTLASDGTHLLSGGGGPEGQDRCIRLWDLESEKEIWHKILPGQVWGVAFSPDNKYFATASFEDNGVRVWDLKTRTVHREFTTRSWNIGVNFSPDSRKIAAALWTGAVNVWDVETKEERVFLGHKGIAESVAFSPDGHYLLSTGEDKTIRLWHLQSGVEVRRFEGHKESVMHAVFSPDGKRILSASRDATVRLWNTETGREICCFEEHMLGVWGVAFSPDGNRALSSSQDRTLRLWKLPDYQEEVPEIPAGEWVDVLKLVTLEKHQVFGRWEKIGQAFHSVPDGRGFARLIIPVVPKGSYELEAAFTSGDFTLPDDPEINFILPVGSTSSMLSAPSHDWVGLQHVNGGPDRKPLEPNPYRPGIRNILRIKVEPSETDDSALITAVMNGTAIYQWKGPLRSLSSRPDWNLHPSTLGLGVHNVAVEFHEIKLKVLTKSATYLPFAAKPPIVSPPPPDPSKMVIRYQTSPRMQFGLEVLENNTPKKLTFDPQGRTHSTLVSVDGVLGEFGMPPGRFAATNVGLGKDADGNPRLGQRSVWVLGKYVVAQTIELVKTGKEAPDSCLVRYDIENQDDKPHQIGLRCLVDTFIVDNDGHPFVITGKKEIINTSADLRGPDNIPFSVQALQRPDLAKPGLTAFFTLKVGSGLEPPDRFVITKLPGVDPKKPRIPWEIPVINIADDSSVVLYWSPRELKPGERRILGYSYGLAEVKLKGMAPETFDLTEPPPPGNSVQERWKLGQAHFANGNQLRDQGRRHDAAVEYRQAIEIASKVVAEFPNMPDYALELGGTCCNLGHALRESKEFEQALAFYDQARGAIEPLLMRDLYPAKTKLFLRNTYWGRASTLDQLKRHPEAQKDWERAQALDEQNVPVIRLGLAKSLAYQGNHAEAASKAAVVAKAKLSGASLFDVACLYGICAGKTGDNAKLQEEYAVQAMQFLQRTHDANGFKDPAKRDRLKTDSDLDSLRSRQDFKTLVNDLEKKGSVQEHAPDDERRKEGVVDQEVVVDRSMFNAGSLLPAISNADRRIAESRRRGAPVPPQRL